MWSHTTTESMSFGQRMHNSTQQHCWAHRRPSSCRGRRTEWNLSKLKISKNCLNSTNLIFPAPHSIASLRVSYPVEVLPMRGIEDHWKREINDETRQFIDFFFIFHRRKCIHLCRKFPLSSLCTVAMIPPWFDDVDWWSAQAWYVFFLNILKLIYKITNLFGLAVGNADWPGAVASTWASIYDTRYEYMGENITNCCLGICVFTWVA